MSISLKTHKMLWGRAANRCAFPDCRRELVMDANETDDESLIGEACHIVAKEPGGPRGESPLTAEQRDKDENLILMCNLHHKMIDDQVNTYTVQRLNELKRCHKDWVRSSLQGYDEAKQRDDELYAGYVEEWARQADIENWLNWTSGMFEAGYQTLSITRDKELRELSVWLFSRIWPKRYHELNAAFENFRRVLQDLTGTMAKHSVEDGNSLKTEKFYKIDEYNPELYHKLSDQYDFHVYLLQDIVMELTRAANYICDRVRQLIDPTYRFREGVLMVQSGMHSDWSYHYHRPEYREPELVLYPYDGLDEFKKVRFTRDEYFGNKATEYEMP